MSPTPEQLAADVEETIADGPVEPGLAEMVRKLVDLKESLDAVEAQRKELQEQYDALRKRHLPEKLAALGLSGARFPFGTLSLRHKTYARVPKERQAQCREWCLANGHQDLLTIHNSTLLGLANEMIEDGRPVPTFIETYTEEVASLTRKGASKE